MIYLMGVNHQIQHDGNNLADYQKRSDFINYLVNKIQKLNVSLIAEEFNHEALEKSKGTNSSCKIAAGVSGIEHRFCDPTTSERKLIGIPSEEEIIKKIYGGPKKFLNHTEKEEINNKQRTYFPLRERYWFDKIKNNIQDKKILFICGKDHIFSFKSLINKKGYDAEIINDWLE